MPDTSQPLPPAVRAVNCAKRCAAPSCGSPSTAKSGATPSTPRCSPASATRCARQRRHRRARRGAHRRRHARLLRGRRPAGRHGLQVRLRRALPGHRQPLSPGPAVDRAADRARQRRMHGGRHGDHGDVRHGGGQQPGRVRPARGEGRRLSRAGAQRARRPAAAPRAGRDVHHRRTHHRGAGARTEARQPRERRRQRERRLAARAACSTSRPRPSAAACTP
jgi:hypothetical protein